MAWLNFMHVKSKNEGKIKTFETNIEIIGPQLKNILKNTKRYSLGKKKIFAEVSSEM